MPFESADPGRLRLLFVVTCFRGGGFNRVVDGLLSGLRDRFEVRVVAIGPDPEPPLGSDGCVHYLRTGLALDDRAPDVRRVAMQLGADLILLYCPPATAPAYIDALDGTPGSLVSYVPVEGRIREPLSLQSLAKVDACVQFTAFGKAELERHHVRPSGESGRTWAIPHGVDLERFHPLAQIEGAWSPACRRRARDLAFPTRPELRDAFIVFNGNRPYERKRLDLTLIGFAAFARDKPLDVKLCLHHPDAARMQRRWIKAMARSLGIAHRLIMSPERHLRVLSDDDLNLLYNACDVGVNTASGEGWGLVSFEHAATGAAQIVPGHSIFPEQWDGAADLLAVGEVCHDGAEYELAAVSTRSLAAALERLYTDRTLLIERSRAAHERVLQNRFRWPHIVGQWETVLRAAASM